MYKVFSDEISWNSDKYFMSFLNTLFKTLTRKLRFMDAKIKVLWNAKKKTLPVMFKMDCEDLITGWKASGSCAGSVKIQMWLTFYLPIWKGRNEVETQRLLKWQRVGFLVQRNTSKAVMNLQSLEKQSFEKPFWKSPWYKCLPLWLDKMMESRKLLHTASVGIDQTQEKTHLRCKKSETPT